MLACSLFFMGEETSRVWWHLWHLVALENEKYGHICLTSWFGYFVKNQLMVSWKEHELWIQMDMGLKAD